MENTSGMQLRNSGSIYTPLFICLAGIAGTSMVLVLYHLVMVNYCMTRQRRALFLSTPVQGGQTHVGKGLEQHVLNAIPIVYYSPENDQSSPGLLDQIRECVICLGEIEEGDKVRFLPNCGHVFHVSCIDGWFSAHTSCPICRATIVVTSISPVVCKTVDRMAPQDAPSLAQFLEQGEEESSYNDDGDRQLVNDSISTQANAVLRRGTSLALPRETKPLHFMGLKRSLSSDPSFIIIDVQRESDRASCSSSSSSSLNVVLMRSKSYGARSRKQLNYIPSKLLTSFPQIRMDRGMANGTLPC